ncbi:hypothetical protein [Microcoleus sp. D3_18a_C4]|uniref:hypothetical protein n=1 Tax=unclassified Microcoleus TaxID=2642155 RepID=UPI002FD2CDFB
MGTDEDSHIQVVRSRLRSRLRSRSRLSETIRSLNHLCRLDAETLPAFDLIAPLGSLRSFN